MGLQRQYRKRALIIMKQSEGQTYSKEIHSKREHDYHEIFFSIFEKNLFKIIIALVAYFGLELHQIDIKAACLNGNLKEEMYIEQPKEFSVQKNKKLVCKLKKSINDLKQTFKQWYLSFIISLLSLNLRKILQINVYI